MKIKGGRIPLAGEIRPFSQAGDLQSSVTFTVEEGKAKFVSAKPHPYLTTDADHAANEFYGDLAMAKAGYLVPEAVAYGVSEKVFKYRDASGEHQEAVGYFVSLLPDEKDERFYENVKGKILKAFNLARKGRLSDTDKQDLRKWLHRAFESYGQTFRKLNEQFIHTRPHTGNVNLEGDQFNIQDNDRVIPIKALSSEDRLAYLIEELFQMLQAVHEYEGVELVGGVKVRLYGERQEEVIAFLRTIGVDLQAAMMRGYFAHVTDAKRVAQIDGAETVDAMAHEKFQEGLVQLFKDEFSGELAIGIVATSAKTSETATKQSEGGRSEQRVAEEASVETVARPIAEALNPENRQLFGPEEAQQIEYVVIRGDLDALIRFAMQVVETELAKRAGSQGVNSATGMRLAAVMDFMAKTLKSDRVQTEGAVPVISQITLALNFSKGQDPGLASFFEELFKVVRENGLQAEIFSDRATGKVLAQKVSGAMREIFSLRPLSPRDIHGGIAVMASDGQNAIPMAL
ncbi:MAG: hypothetical protein WCK00_18090, partial [Deltaproteobacteria bacterium]